MGRGRSRSRSPGRRRHRECENDHNERRRPRRPEQHPERSRPNRRSSGEFGTGKSLVADDGKSEKQKPDMKLSGKLMEDTNVFNGVVVKYSEPPEAKKPKKRWRFYVFKGEESLPVMHLHRQSAYLIGKDRKVADIPVDHPSCSRQHAALQYRAVERQLTDGRRVSRVVPYVIDLDSSNGTYVNNQRIEARRYVELREKDVIKFGYSSREYVMLHDQSQADDDD